MVGTAVYQVGFASSIQAKNFRALKPGAANTVPPADSGANNPAISPWMWKSGMMLRFTSEAVSAKVFAMLPAETVRFAWLKGTILGREVVPDVCSTNAASPSLAYSG